MAQSNDPKEIVLLTLLQSQDLWMLQLQGACASIITALSAGSWIANKLR